MKYGKLKQVVICCFFVNMFCFGSGAYAACETTGCSTEALLNQILSKATTINTTLRNTKTTLDSTKTTLEDTKVTLDASRTILDTIHTVLVETKVYVVSIEDYVRKIYEFLIQPRIGTMDAVRYLALAKVEGEIKTRKDEMAKKMNNLMQYGVYETEVDLEALNRPLARGEGPGPSTVGQSYDRPAEHGDDPAYSTTLAQSFYGTDAYENDDQAAAAEDFVKNVVASIALGIPSKSDSADEKQKERFVTQKMLLAIQSVAASNLIESFLERVRIPISESDILISGGSADDVTGFSASKLELLKEMNTADPSNPDYWGEDSEGNKGVGSLGIIPRMFAFFNSFFTMNYNLSHITHQLDKVNLQLSLMMTQNTMIHKELGGMFEGMETAQALRSSAVESIRGEVEKGKEEWEEEKEELREEKEEWKEES